MVIAVPDHRPLRRAGVLRGLRDPVRRRAAQEPVRGPDVHPAVAVAARPRREAEAEPAARLDPGQAPGRGRRLDRAGHDHEADRRDAPRGGRHRGPHPDHVPADQVALLLRDRHDARGRSSIGGRPGRRGDPRVRRRRLPRLPLARGAWSRRDRSSRPRTFCRRASTASTRSPSPSTPASSCSRISSGSRRRERRLPRGRGRHRGRGQGRRPDRPTSPRRPAVPRWPTRSAASPASTGSATGGCWRRPPTAWAPSSRSRERPDGWTPWASTSSRCAPTTSCAPAPSRCSSSTTSRWGASCPSASPAIVEGVAEGCRRAGCALLGGETAEHPGVMADDQFDLAGFCVGVVDEADLLGPAPGRARATSSSGSPRAVCTRTATRSCAPRSSALRPRRHARRTSTARSRTNCSSRARSTRPDVVALARDGPGPRGRPHHRRRASRERPACAPRRPRRRRSTAARGPSTRSSVSLQRGLGSLRRRHVRHVQHGARHGARRRPGRCRRGARAQSPCGVPDRRGRRRRGVRLV